MNITENPLAEATTKRCAFDASGNLIYEGWSYSSVNASTSDAAWAIRKHTYDSDDQLVLSQWADGNWNSDNIWDNRASLSYK